MPAVVVQCVSFLTDNWPASLQLSRTAHPRICLYRLDYCNSVLSLQFSAAAVHLCPVQAVLNAAATARLMSTRGKYHYDQLITATVRDDLHWLPVGQQIRIVFKLSLFTYKCQRQIAPSM